jgi:hypothetical protein
MKKIGVVLSLLAMGACSSNHKYWVASNGTDKETFTELSQPFVNNVERKPSSEIVSRPRYYWEADSLKIPLTAEATINQSYNVKFNQFSVYDVKQQVEKIVPQVETRWELIQNSVLVCDEQSGTGKSPYWNAFYSAPPAKKAAALADAIEGVGPVSSAALVKHHYFAQKPRNWSDFREEIQRAARNEVINKNVEHQILYKYRSENMAKLGYNTQLSGVCKLETESYYAPRVNRRVIVDEIITHRDLITTEFRNYQVRISGQRLQSFESEMLILNFDHDSNQVTLSQAAYNNFSVSFEGSLITITGISRKAIKLPENVFTGAAFLEGSGGKARFSAPINRMYVPRTSADGQLLVSVRVYSCKQGFFGGCSITNRDERTHETAIKDVTPGSGYVNHQFSISPGRRYWVSYWVYAANSPWYINNVVSGYSTPEI